jgi:hypothetical protein
MASTYGRWFDNPVEGLILSGDIIIEMDHLSLEQKSVVIAWVKAHADRAAAEAKLREVLKQALFDVTAAELGALLHKPNA